MNNNRKGIRWVRFALVLIISGIVGGVIGFFSLVGTAMVDVQAVLAQLEQGMAVHVNALLVGGTAVLLAIALLLFGTGYRMYADGVRSEDEARIESGDRRMGLGLGITTLGFIWDFFVFGTACGAENLGIVFVAVFLVCAIMICVVQVKMIDWTKKLMPEKRGDATRMNFQKEWMESCDEAEQYAVFKACYRTHMFMQKLMLVLIVLCLLARLMLGIGMSALVAVSLIWAAQTIVYTIFSSKYSAEKLN